MQKRNILADRLSELNIEKFWSKKYFFNILCGKCHRSPSAGTREQRFLSSLIAIFLEPKSEMICNHVNICMFISTDFILLQEYHGYRLFLNNKSNNTRNVTDIGSCLPSIVSWLSESTMLPLRFTELDYF